MKSSNTNILVSEDNIDVWECLHERILEKLANERSRKIRRMYDRFPRRKDARRNNDDRIDAINKHSKLRIFRTTGCLTEMNFLNGVVSILRHVSNSYAPAEDVLLSFSF